MIRVLALLVLFLLGAALRSAGGPLTEPRVWRSADGKKLHGTLLRASDKGIHLKVTRGGKKVNIPLTRLSDDEQASVLAWLKTNPDGIAPPRPPFDWPDRFSGEQQPKITYLSYDEKAKAHVFRAKHYDLYSDEKLSEATVSKCAAVFDSVVGALDSLPLGLQSHSTRRRAALPCSARQFERPLPRPGWTAQQRRGLHPLQEPHDGALPIGWGSSRRATTGSSTAAGGTSASSNTN